MPFTTPVRHPNAIPVRLAGNSWRGDQCSNRTVRRHRLHRLLEDVFSAASLQRLRLSTDQQILERQGPAAPRRSGRLARDRSP